MILTGIGINFSSDMINSMIAYISDVFADLDELLLLVIGVGIALIVIGALVRAIRGH